MNFRQQFNRYFRQDLLPLLADLRLAIILLLLIALFSITGTVIEQGQSLEFYQTSYPESPALFGFLSWRVILIAGLDHVYRTWWFLALLILFGASLTACTFTRQFPALGAARRWTYYSQPRQFQKLIFSAEITGQESFESVLERLRQARYRVFQAETSLYARKGIVGRIGPIIVHASMLMILMGAIWGAMTGFSAQEMVPSGQNFQIRNIFDAGPWASAQIPKDWSVQVNRFWIDYTPEGSIDQFYSDLSVLDARGQEVDRKIIHVNQPLRYRGVTFYQADWGIAAVRVKLNSSPILQMPVTQLDQESGRIWGTWLPTQPDLSEGVTLVAKDLQGTVLVYNNEGQLAATVRSGFSTDVNGVTLSLVEVVGSTGLQIKADPGIPLVYTGFGLLMLGVMMSYISHSQVWVLSQDGKLYIGGRTNRAQVGFEREMLTILADLENCSKLANLTLNPVNLSLN